MPAERTVVCPACQATRPTRANPGVALLCRECGHKFLAPAIEPAAGAAGRPPASADDRAAPGGVKVTRGRPVITQNARPRPRGGDTATQPAGEPPSPATSAQDPPPGPGEPAGGGAVPPAGPPTGGRDGKTGDLEQLTQAGRRGGLASYAKGRIRGR